MSEWLNWLYILLHIFTNLSSFWEKNSPEEGLNEFYESKLVSFLSVEVVVMWYYFSVSYFNSAF